MTGDYWRAFAGRAFSILSSVAIGVGSLKLYSAHLTTEAYGGIAGALVLIGYLPFLDGGVRTTANRVLLATADPARKAGLIRFAQSFYLLFGLVAVISAELLMLGYALTPNASKSGQSLGFFLVLGLTGAGTVLAWAQVGLLVGLREQSKSFWLIGLNSWVAVISLWIFLENGADVWAFPLSALAATLFMYSVGVLMLRSVMPGIRLYRFKMDAEFWQYWAELKADAWQCFRSQISIIVLFSIDVVLVGLFATAEETAIYALLSRLFGLMRNLLQTTSEVAWPLVAEDASKGERLSFLLLRANAWVYGSVMGAVAMVLQPFLAWFMRNDLAQNWVPAQALVWLMVVRFWITGNSSPASYFLLGVGSFRTIARYIERELAAALILGLVLGWRWGTNGVALGFLLATVFGTFGPMFWAYAQRVGESFVAVLTRVWWRSALAFGVSVSAAHALSPWAGTGSRTIWIGAAGVALGFAFGGLISLGRMAFNRAPVRLGRVFHYL